MQKRTARRRILLRTNLTHTTHTHGHRLDAHGALAADWSMTHSAPDMPGWTPSAMHTDSVRTWSATTLYAMSTFTASAAPVLPPYGPALDL